VAAGATFECFKKKTLKNTTSIYNVRARPLSRYKCSVVCVQDQACQGFALTPQGPQFSGGQIGGEELYNCSFFTLGARIRADDMAEQAGQVVCRHIYRDTMK
jgi:hypothetical protein